MTELSDPIPLSPFERWALIMQAKTRLDSASHDSVRSELRAAISCLENGYEEWYQDCLGTLFAPFPKEKSSFVNDLLNLYFRLEGFLKTNEGSRGEFEGMYWAKFRGFGGNEETDYYSYVKWLVEEKGLFSELAVEGIELNAHMPTLNAYRPMVEEYRERLRHGSGQLSLEDYRAILKASERHKVSLPS